MQYARIPPPRKVTRLPGSPVILARVFVPVGSSRSQLLETSCPGSCDVAAAVSDRISATNGFTRYLRGGVEDDVARGVEDGVAGVDGAPAGDVVVWVLTLLAIPLAPLRIKMFFMFGSERKPMPES